MNNKFPVKQVNILELNRGSVFGNHYHKAKKELFYVVSGTVVLTILNMKKGGEGYRQSISYTFFQGDAFIVEPYDSHTLFTPEGKAVVVELLSKPFSERDTFCVFEEE